METQLQTFLVVCQEMNFTRAAELLHLTQPAVSYQMRWLEKEYGTALFRFEGKRMLLTSAGQVLKEAASAMREEEENVRRKLLAVAQEKKTLRLGATRTIGDFFIASALGKYIREHPGTELELTVGNTDMLLEALRRRQLDCALIEGFFDPQEFDAACCQSEAYVAVCATGHTFGAPPATLRDLVGERLLVRERGSGTRMLMEQAMQREGLDLRDFSAITQLGSMRILLELVAQDVGVSFLYRIAAQPLLQSGVLRELPLQGFPVSHDFSLIWSKHTAGNMDYRKLCQELRNC